MGRRARKIVNFLDRLIKSDTRESSKRAIALFVTLLIGIIVVLYTNSENVLLVLAELIAFVTTLLYIATNGKFPKLPQMYKDENTKTSIEPNREHGTKRSDETSQASAETETDKK